MWIKIKKCLKIWATKEIKEELDEYLHDYVEAIVREVLAEREEK